MKLRKCIEEILKIFFSKTTEPVSTKLLHKASLDETNSSLHKYGPFSSQNGDFFSLLINVVIYLCANVFMD